MGALLQMHDTLTKKKTQNPENPCMNSVNGLQSHSRRFPEYHLLGKPEKGYGRGLCCRERMRCNPEPMLVPVGVGWVTTALLALMQVKMGNKLCSKWCHVISAWKEARKNREMTEAPWSARASQGWSGCLNGSPPCPSPGWRKVEPIQRRWWV